MECVICNGMEWDDFSNSLLLARCTHIKSRLSSRILTDSHSPPPPQKALFDGLIFSVSTSLSVLCGSQQSVEQRHDEREIWGEVKAERRRIGDTMEWSFEKNKTSCLQPRSFLVRRWSNNHRIFKVLLTLRGLQTSTREVPLKLRSSARPKR